MEAIGCVLPPTPAMRAKVAARPLVAIHGLLEPTALARGRGEPVRRRRVWVGLSSVEFGQRPLSGVDRALTGQGGLKEDGGRREAPHPPIQRSAMCLRLRLAPPATQACCSGGGLAEWAGPVAPMSAEGSMCVNWRGPQSIFIQHAHVNRFQSLGLNALTPATPLACRHRRTAAAVCRP